MEQELVKQLSELDSHVITNLFILFYTDHVLGTTFEEDFASEFRVASCQENKV